MSCAFRSGNDELVIRVISSPVSDFLENIVKLEVVSCWMPEGIRNARSLRDVKLTKSRRHTPFVAMCSAISGKILSRCCEIY